MRYGSDGGEELGVGEQWIRRRRRSSCEPVVLGPPRGLAGDGSGGNGRRGGGLPIGLAIPRSVGLSEGFVAAVNLVTRATARFLFFIAWATGPTSHIGWPPPIRAQRESPARSLDRAGEINSNILPLDLSLFLFLFFI